MHVLTDQQEESCTYTFDSIHVLTYLIVFIKYSVQRDIQLHIVILNIVLIVLKLLTSNSTYTLDSIHGLTYLIVSIKYSIKRCLVTNGYDNY